jgi:EmrB/QacA subfamily drug resistance transporter
MSPPPEDPASRGSSSAALAGLSLTMLMAAMGTSVANAALPTFVEVFAASFQQVQWIVLAYLLTITTLIVSVGRLGDMTGRPRLLVGGILLFTLASAGCGVAPTLWSLIAARGIQGLGAAVMMTLSMALVSETVPEARIGRAMGLLGSMSAVGTALGPSLGGLLVAGIGWRAIFFVNIPLGIAACLLLRRQIPNARTGRRETAGFDVLGTLLLAVSLGAYALAMTAGHGRFSGANLALLIVAGLGTGLFILAQTRAESPLLQLKMFRDPGLSAGLAMSALISTVTMATMVVGPFYLSRALGLGAAGVGLVLSVGPFAAAGIGLPAGRLADRFGTKRMTAAGLAVTAAGCLLLCAIPGTLGLYGYIPAVVVVTSGYALFQAANSSAVMAGVEANRRGVAAGMLNLARNLGLVTGASAMGALFAAASGSGALASASPEAVERAMAVTFGVATVLIMIALAIGALCNGMRNRPAPSRPRLPLANDRLCGSER